METSTSSDNSQPKPASPEAQLKIKLQDLKDLFESPAWHLFQEELVKVRRRALEAVVQTQSKETQEYYISVARGLSVLISPNFTEGALQDAGQTIDKPEPPQHPMSLDSEGRRALAATKAKH